MNEMNNNNREHTVCFYVLDSGNYLIRLTVQTFHDFTRQWIGN